MVVDKDFYTTGQTDFLFLRKQQGLMVNDQDHLIDSRQFILLNDPVEKCLPFIKFQEGFGEAKTAGESGGGYDCGGIDNYCSI
jgi:hypothetical protein